MATEKKTAAKTTAAKTETKATAAKTETKAPAVKAETKAPAKKAATKKAAPKKAATKVELFIEFGGVQVSADEIIENVKKVNGKDAKNIAVYVKPEESKAYFVADGEEKEMDVYFI